jgi:hypothetical protein
MNYSQCLLHRRNSRRVGWIPSKYAKKGKVLCLKQEDGWVVEEVWKTESEEYVKSRCKDHDKWAVGRGLRK